MSSYWSSPRWLQKLIGWIVPKKQTWNLTCEKDYIGPWTFDIFPVIFNEPLIGGTDANIDFFYKKLTDRKAKHGDRVKLTVSTRKPKKSPTTILVHQSQDEFGGENVYVDQTNGFQCWLCAVNQLVFGRIPEKIYVTVKPLKSKRYDY